MLVHVAAVFIGDVTPYGVVTCVESTKHNRSTLITFDTGKKKRFGKYEEIEVSK